MLAATGAVGGALVRLLIGRGDEVIAVGRDSGRLARLPGGCKRRVADFTDRQSLRNALEDATLIAACGNAVHLPAILAALPPEGTQRLVVMGSTRCFSSVPDATAIAVREAEALLAALSLPSVLLLSAMIYGTGRSVLDRLAKLPVIAVPQGRSVQPIHVDDVAACLAAALERPAAVGSPIVVAGPTPIAYAQAVRRVAKGRFVLPVPPAALDLLGRVLGRSGIGAELRRLAENKSLDIGAMQSRLGVNPRPFDPPF